MLLLLLLLLSMVMNSHQVYHGGLGNVERGNYNFARQQTATIAAHAQSVNNDTGCEDMMFEGDERTWHKKNSLRIGREC